MKTIEYRHREQERQKWGAGPWDDEPDKIQWQDGQTGFPCLLVRNPMGAWCGYVGVNEMHPYFGKDWADLESTGAVVEVHGGLTFSDFCEPIHDEHGICHIVEPGENDRVWWLGFDCAHFRDLVPGLAAYWPKMSGYGVGPFGESYKSVEYVRNEVGRLAWQLAELD